jgi:tetratricopeptide (TPR) repeat protein
MFKHIIAVAAILSFNASGWADYPSDRKAAMELVKAGKNEEALSAFEKMAEGTAVEAQKSDAIEQAAMCAKRLKKYDQAIELAGKIPVVPMAKTVQMRIMLENGKVSEILTKFKDESIADWPSKAAGEASYCRGIAYFNAKDGKAAEADLKNALKNLAPERMADEARFRLADNYKDNLKDDQQALAAYLEGIEKSIDAFGWIRLQSIVSASEILSRQSKHDEALAVLGKVDSGKMTGTWKYNFILAYANVAAAQGKKDEAIAKLNEGLAAKDIADWQKPAFQQKLKELQPEAK